MQDTMEFGALQHGTYTVLVAERKTGWPGPCSPGKECQRVARRLPLLRSLDRGREGCEVPSVKPVALRSCRIWHCAKAVRPLAGARKQAFGYGESGKAERRDERARRRAQITVSVKRRRGSRRHWRRT